MSRARDSADLSTGIDVDSSGNVGIGTSSPDRTLHVNSGGSNGVATFESTDATAVVWVADGNSANTSQVGLGAVTDNMLLYAGGTERMRIDSSGNLLVGTTSSFGSSGITLGSNSVIYAAASSQNVANFQRYTTDGEIVRFGKDGSTVGSIGSRTSSDSYISLGVSGLTGSGTGGGALLPTTGGTTYADNVVDLGFSSGRFDNIYATNGTIQTSDRNEKQDIEALSDAEQRVAVACKSLLRKFRWIDRVAEKGDNARIHFGIIAQDLQDAFTAEGLDAGRYAMFISSTWWETQTDVPAVEADEENGIEAKDAYTRTDTYETLEEAPEGATERTRLGVRYPELLAFIIGAM